MAVIDKDTLCKIALFVDVYSIEKKNAKTEYTFWRKLHYFIQATLKKEKLTDYYYENYFFEALIKNDPTSEEIEKKYPLENGYGNTIMQFIMANNFK